MNENSITVLGHGEVKAMPDYAALTLSVTAQAADQTEAVRQNAEQTQAVRAVLHENGIADKDIQTHNYRVQPQHIRRKIPLAPDSYWVQNSLQVTVRDLERIGPVIDKATANGALSVDYVSFGLSDRAQAEAEALTRAVFSAQRRAGVMTAAAGVELGRLVSIAEGISNTFPSLGYAGGTLSSAPTLAETPISEQQIILTADVTLVYALGAAK